MQDFSSFNLPEEIMLSLSELKFTTPTPVQEQVIPIALAGRDVLASAQTGTGKTGAFGIPLITKLLQNKDAVGLVIAPTRELAVQVMAMLNKIAGKKSSIRSVLLIGGESIFQQLQQLKNNPRLVVGTPGRINDHLMRKTLKLNKASFLVLDETDRMLDMGFTPQIDKILEFLPTERQTLLFSATLPKNIISMSRKYLTNPENIYLGQTSTPATNIKQEIVYLGEKEKQDKLKSELDQREGSVIIFVKTKYGAEIMAKQLRQDNHSADAIHGDLSHNRREKVINGFRNLKYRIMVATDIAARGLDIAHVRHVINYDLPQCPEDYIHRIGRTARAGAEGSALCFVTPADKSKWHAIRLLIDPTAKQEQMPKKVKSRGQSAAGSGFNRNGKSSFGARQDRSDKPPSRGGNNSFSQTRRTPRQAAFKV